MALSIKLLFVVFGAMGMASMWEAVFADMGVSLAAVANSTRMLRGKWL
jgi:Cd2+/Zn2+-exporting ATPase